MVAKLIGRTGPVARRDYPLDAALAVLRLGAAPTNEVCIRAVGVSRDHARIIRRDGGCWVEDAGSTNGTFLNGSRITTELLRHLDVLTLGRNVDLIYVESLSEGEHAAPPAIVHATLEWLDGPLAGQTAALQLGETLVGRAPSNTMVFDHPAIGKTHARMIRTAAQISVEDLQSSNGTYVNDRRIHREVLKNGDRIAFAGVRAVRLRVESDFKRGVGEIGATAVVPTFDQSWRTKLVWSPTELAEIDANTPLVIELMEKPAATSVADGREPPPAAGHAPATPPMIADPLAQRVTTRGPDPSPEATVVSRPAEQPPPQRTELPLTGVDVTRGDTHVRLGLGVCRIGRALDAEICIDAQDRGVSRIHALLTVAPDGVTVEDRSQNGTFVNDQRVTGRQRVQDGDRIRCGAAVLGIRFLREASSR